MHCRDLRYKYAKYAIEEGTKEQKVSIDSILPKTLHKIPEDTELKQISSRVSHCSLDQTISVLEKNLDHVSSDNEQVLKDLLNNFVNINKTRENYEIMHSNNMHEFDESIYQTYIPRKLPWF
jgi:Tfp pilus assembly protein PilO